MWARGIFSMVAGAAVTLWLGGCGGEDDGVTCGPGTVRLGDTCVADDSRSGGGGEGGGGAVADGGTATDPGGGSGGGGGSTADAGSGFGTEPPGDAGAFRGSPGCSEADGECDAWEEGIVAGLRTRQAASGCDTELVPDERVDRVAERHAAYQASVDRLDPSSPDGNLFEQIGAEGVRFRDAAAMFSVTRLGAEDVLGRWADNPEVAPLLTRCGYMTGVGVTTSDTGASYVTVLMVRL